MYKLDTLTISEERVSEEATRRRAFFSTVEMRTTSSNSFSTEEKIKSPPAMVLRFHIRQSIMDSLEKSLAENADIWAQLS